MNQKIENIVKLILGIQNITDEEKNNAVKALQDVNKELEITAFKLDRTEKVKKTTSILLEETIEELELKRKAVEAQNRELEIEKSLEKVRAIAMAMRKPDDMLEVCKTISLQLEFLGVAGIRNVQTAIFYENRGTYMNYEYYAKHDKTFITETTYTNNELHQEFAEKMLKGKGEFFITHINGKEVIDWIAYQKTTNVFIDNFLETASSLNYYWFSLGPVALGISTYQPLAEEEINLFKRFLKVFELSYQRYLDIEKAEAQARESEIQLALERVRARSLAMHNTSELQEVVNLLAQQLYSMNLDINGGVWIAINDQVDNGLQLWASGGMAEYVQKVNVPFLDSPIFIELRNAIKRKNNFFTEERSDEEKIILFKHLFNFPPWNSLPQQKKEELLSRKGGYTRSVAISSLTSISITNHNGKKFSDDDNKILKRFGNVFEQSYIRFLDLQKAEAQAREAQIEASLERVRSRTMAMQHSKELSEVASDMFAQIEQLGLKPWSCGFHIFDHEKEVISQWVSSGDGRIIKPFETPSNEDVFRRIFDASQKGDDLFVEKMDGEKLRKHYKYMASLPTLSEIFDELIKEGIELPKQQVNHAAFFKQGYVMFITYEHVPEFHEIFKRFANVFEQTYTRFLDLQKAEAQTREAQIEAALERVRSRSMAMFNSEDLSAVVFEMFTELIKLDAQLDRCIIMIVDPNTLGINWYLSGKEGLLSNNGFFVQNNSHPSHNAYLDGWRTKRKKWQYHLAGEEKKNWDEFGFTQTGLAKLPDFIKADMSAVESIHLTISSDDFGSLIASSLSPLSEAHANIVERFTKVFNQTYTRFLDLQKAETQKKIIQAENERKTRELEDARKLQLAMLPKELPKLSKLDIAVHMQTATEVGGDYYDFSFKDNGSLNICIGDATGHGLKAGTVVSIMKSLFIADSVRLDIKNFFTSSNDTLKKMSLDKMMIAFAMVNIYGREIKIANAGIPPVFIFRKEKKYVEEVALHCLPIGAMRRTDYDVYSTELNDGDAVLLLSDGFPEQQNTGKEMYGYERLKRVFTLNGSKNSGEIISILKEECNNWKMDREQNDDITFIVIKLK